MALTTDDFTKEPQPGVFSASHLSEDGHAIMVSINLDSNEEEQQLEEMVPFVRDFLAQEMPIRHRAAGEMFAKHEEIQSELGYATAEDFFKALKPGSLYLRSDQYDLIMVFLSPADDLKMPTGTHVIMACQDFMSGELEIHLEQDSDC